jgi:hypothetical protein
MSATSEPHLTSRSYSIPDIDRKIRFPSNLDGISANKPNTETKERGFKVTNISTRELVNKLLDSTNNRLLTLEEEIKNRKTQSLIHNRSVETE